MSREIVNKSPTRKTLVTGESLPAVETEERPIPLGYDEDGEPDAQIRAFAVLARNRADSTVYIREGATDDENAIDPGEAFQIWEPDGVTDVAIRGENGGERVEFRTLEAHNDFSITDKIDAFARALSHFFGTSRRSTTIDGDVSIGTISDSVDIGTVAGDIDVSSLPDVTIGTINDGIDANITNSSLTVDSVTGGIDANVAGTVDIGTFSDTVTVDDITAASATFTVDSVTGGIDANVAGNVTVDDINATSASFDGDITGQTDFDLSTFGRTGQTDIISADGGGLSAGTFSSQLSQTVPDYYHYDIKTSATYDGRIERVEARFFDYQNVNGIGFKVMVDYGSDGTYQTVSPRYCNRADTAEKFGSEGSEVFTPRFYPQGEVAIIWEPNEPIAYEAGDSVAIEIGPHDGTAGTGTYDAEIEVRLTDIVNQG